METLSRRFSHSFGTWSGFKNSIRHGRSLGNIISQIPAYYNSNGVKQSQFSDIPSTQRDKMDTHAFSTNHDRTTCGPTPRGTITSRSLSLNSVNSEGSDPTPTSTSLPVGHEDILALTQDVRSFKDALSHLRRIFHPERDKQEQIRSTAHERLGNVLRILRGILEKYAALQSTELLMAAGQLIQQIKGFNFEDEKADPTEFFEAIDQVALSFSSRVSEYLMGDLDTSSSVHPAVRAKSCELLSNDDGSEVDGETSHSKKLPDVLSSQQIDETLMRLEQGVNVALKRAKAWSKYAKDVITYVEKRSAFELEHSRSIAKLTQTMKSVLSEESYLPFQSVYCKALDQDAMNANLMQATCSLLQGHKFIEPLTARRNEHEKIRKQLKETWQKEVKKTQEAVNNLRKARSLYIQRQLEYEKAKDSVQRAECVEGLDPSKIDKKKKVEEDVLQKAIEADTTYKACVVEANEKHQNMQRVKAEILKKVRELILQCDQTMKAVTVSYFQLQHSVAAPLPFQFQTHCENSRLYEPGSELMEFVRRLPVPANAPVFEPPPFIFEPYQPTDSRLSERRSNGGLEGSDESLAFSSSCASSDQGKEKKTWCPTSDSDSVGSNQSNKSVDTSPFGSPCILIRRLEETSEDLDVDQDVLDSGDGQSRGLSKAAVTHRFRKLKTPSRCRECDGYLYFQGIECFECGLVCHKKCAEVLTLQCGHTRLRPKLTTFGVELVHHLAETKLAVPLIVTRCIDQVEKRGAHIKGIYRVSGVKSKVEKLCQSFENSAELVDLTDIHPNVISNVLKLYFRQLPEPLMTYKLYNDFIKVAKNFPGRSCDAAVSREVLKELKLLLNNLPRPHFTCLGVIIHHLKRIGELSDINNMPPSNLGIVFGPTLLRTSEGTASLNSLIDTVHQTRIIELLIIFADELFGHDSRKIDLKQINDNLVEKEERCETPEKNDPSTVYCDNEATTLNVPNKINIKDEDNLSIHSFDVTDGEGEPPIPPPRRQTSNTKINRMSSTESFSDEMSSSPSLPHLCKTDRIVIHVESDHPVAAPRTLAPSDFIKTKKDDDDDDDDDVPYVDDSPPDTCKLSPVKPVCPVPSPRFSHLARNSQSIPVTITPSTDDEDHQDSSELKTTSSLASSVMLQRSPVNSIPSTTSSMDELDIAGASSSVGSCSPISTEYVSSYLGTDPYKNLRVDCTSLVSYSDTTTFPNDESPQDTQHPHADFELQDEKNELGPRTSILRTATRFQRYSPAYSTSSTKSSELSWSSGPDVVAMAMNSDGCCKPFLSQRGAKQASVTPTLHRVSSDSSVFVKSALNGRRGGASQRPPRFV